MTCPDGTTVYACGPAPMLTAIRTQLAGRDNVELHFERFAAPPVIDGKEFSVSISSTGAIVRVGADETVLAALGAAGARRTPAGKASAAPAGRGCSTARSTIATRCSPIPSATTA